jgi:hypothetical protein
MTRNGIEPKPFTMDVGHAASVDRAAAHFDRFRLFRTFRNFSSETALSRSALDRDLSFAMRSNSSSLVSLNSLCRCRLPIRGTLAATLATAPDPFATIRRSASGGPAQTILQVP